MSKHFNTAHHQDYYHDWHYLGSDDKFDYYVSSWGKTNFKFTDTPYLSIVYGADPSKYMSPDYKHMLIGGYDKSDIPHYHALKQLLLNNGYYLTGKFDSSDDWETDSVNDWV